ncbi:hypothetical protein Tco_0381690, partial [Tanacetum coccineum]
RRPTLGLLVLPSALPNPPTIRRTARISIPPIEPNLAELARISAINLDDYQFDPLTPPPSPSSPFTMAAYQRMIAETDPTQREEALTETGQNSVPVPETALTVCITRLRGQLHTILEDMDRYPNACLEELEAFMTLWDDAEDCASNAQEEARQKRKEALEEVIQRIYHAQPAQCTRVCEALAAALWDHAASTPEEANTRHPTLPEQGHELQGFRAIMHENFFGTSKCCRLSPDGLRIHSPFRIATLRGGRSYVHSAVLPRNELKQNGT